MSHRLDQDDTSFTQTAASGASLEDGLMSRQPPGFEPPSESISPALTSQAEFEATADCGTTPLGIPVVAPTHSGAPRPLWATVEIDSEIVQSAQVVNAAIRRDCSKTQYLRTLLQKAHRASLLLFPVVFELRQW
jgi:hypothetical protein